MKKITARLVGSPLSLSAMTGLASMFFVTVANAQISGTPPPAPIKTLPALKSVLCRFISYFITALLIVCVIMVLMAAWDYLTAADDAEKTTRARKRLTYAAVGVAVLLLADTFPYIVSTLFSDGLIQQSTC